MMNEEGELGRAALSYAFEVLTLIRATLDTVFHDHPKDLVDPSRKPYLRHQYKIVSAAIAELQRTRIDTVGQAALSYTLEVLIRVRAVLDTIFHDHPDDLASASRKSYLRQQYKEVRIAISEVEQARIGS